MRVLSRDYDNFGDVWARVVQFGAVSLPSVYFPALFLFLNLYPRRMCGVGPLALGFGGLELGNLPRGVSVVQRALEPKLNTSKASAGSWTCSPC